MTEEASTKNLQKFLKSKDKALMTMGLSMAKNVDLSDRLIDTIAGHYMWHDDNTIRNKARAVFMKKASEKTKDIMKRNWKTKYRTDELPPMRQMIEELKKEKLNGLASIIQRNMDSKLKKFINNDKKRAIYYRTHYSIIGKDYQKILDASPKNPYYNNLDLNAIEILGNAIISQSSNRPWYHHGLKGFIGDIENFDIIDNLLNIIDKYPPQDQLVSNAIITLANRFEALTLMDEYIIPEYGDFYSEEYALSPDFDEITYKGKKEKFKDKIFTLFKKLDGKNSNTKISIAIATSLISENDEGKEIIKEVTKMSNWSVLGNLVTRKNKSKKTGEISELKCNCPHPQTDTRFRTYDCIHKVRIAELFIKVK